jgi:TldD protein
VKQVMASLATTQEVVLVVRTDGVIAGDVRPLVRLNDGDREVTAGAAGFRRRGPSL